MLDRSASSGGRRLVRVRTAMVWALLLAALGGGSCRHAHRQAPDFTYQPAVARPAFEPATAPRVVIDGGHCNFHTADERYRPLADLWRADGLIVEPIDLPLTAESLGGAEVLVIANALSAENCDRWELPITSAFRASEVTEIRSWVERGGSLLLIADHMPFPGAASELAAAFGLVFIDSYVRADDGSGPALRFDRTGGSLGAHAITEGRSPEERIEAVVSFTGQGFHAVRAVDPLLILPAGTTARLPEEAGVFTERTPSFSAEGLFQGVALRHGDGRVAAFGEAAMFTAQRVHRDDQTFEIGLNAPGAEQNAQFALNVVHWLTGLLD